MSPSRIAGLKDRRGAIAVLAVLLILVAFAIVALAVDTGYMLLVRTQMQCAVDSAAIAAAGVLHESREAAIDEAQRFARLNFVAGEPCELRRDQIQIGRWRSDARDFSEVAGATTAVRITANIDHQPLFFGKAVGRMFFGTNASSGGTVEAVAMSKPRDIVFVIDVSGGMNDDSEFASGRNGDKPTYHTYLQRLYEDLDFGDYPGVLEPLGKPLGMTSKNSLDDLLIALSDESIPAEFRVSPDDHQSVRESKLYSWLIKVQIPTIMPQATPDPTNDENLGYWRQYLDYVSQTSLSQDLYIPNGDEPAPRDYVNTKDENRLKNPQVLAFRNSTKHAKKLLNQIGYLTYLQYMLDVGSDREVAGQFVPLSVKCPECPWHPETTDLGIIDFPPRVEPEHSMRRAIVDVIGRINDLNDLEGNTENRDRVAIILFSQPSIDSTILIPLTDDYRSVMTECAKIQALADVNGSTSPQTGLQLARQHLLPKSEGGQGRDRSDKVVFLVLSSRPDSYSCTQEEISTIRAVTGDKNFFGKQDRIAEDAALMEVSNMRLKKWQVNSAGISKGVERDLLDRLERVCNPNDPRKNTHAGTAPDEYMESLKEVLSDNQKRLFSLVF